MTNYEEAGLDLYLSRETDQDVSSDDGEPDSFRGSIWRRTAEPIPDSVLARSLRKQISLAWHLRSQARPIRDALLLTEGKSIKDRYTRDSFFFAHGRAINLPDELTRDLRLMLEIWQRARQEVRG